MDAIDQQIIALLSADSRTSATEIGKRVGRSRVAVTNRIATLLESGEISAFGITLKGKPFPALFEVSFKPQGNCDLLVPRFRNYYPLKKAWSVTGSTDLFIWTEAESAKDIHAMRSFLLNQIEVARVSTHSIIRTYE